MRSRCRSRSGTTMNTIMTLFTRVTQMLICACLVHLAQAEPSARQTLPGFLDKPAPAFTLPDVDGNLHQLSDYRGKVVVLNFWATWCPPCRYEMPAMERLRQQVQGDAIVVLAINVGEDEDTVFEFTGSYPVEFPLLLDQQGKVIEDYPVVGLPTTYIIGPQGRIRYRAVGSREWDDPALIEELRALLNRDGQEIPVD